MKAIWVKVPLVAMLVSMVGLIWLVPAAPTSMGDSDELISIGSRLGLLHSPGYPLLTGLIYLANLVFPGATVAYRVNLLAIVIQAAVNGLGVYLAQQWLRKYFPQLKKSEIAGISVLGGVSLASSLIILSWSAVMEVFSFASVLMYGFMALAQKIEEEGKNKLNRKWLVAGLLLVLAMGHHHLAWLMAPGAIWWFYRKAQSLDGKAKLIIGLGGLLLVIGIYGINFGAVKWLNENPNRPAWSWSIESTSEAVRNYLFRDVYGGVMVENGTQAGAYFKPVNFQVLQKAGIAYVKESVRLMGWVNVIMIALGGFWWFKQRKQHTPIDHFFGWSLLLLGPGLAAYLGGNEGVDYQVRSMTERMYLMGYQLMGLMMPLGISWLHSKLSNHIQLRRWLWGLVIILIGVNVWSSLKVVKAQNQPLAYSLSKEALLKVEEKSVIWCFGDISCFSLIYLQQIEGLRPDVTVLTQSPYLQKAKTKEAVDIKQTGNYPDNPFRISDITATSLKYGRAVYVAELPDFYRQWLGLDQGILSARKDGLLMKLGCDFAGHQNSEVVIKPPIEETNSSYLRSIYQAYMKSVDLKTDCFWRNKSDQCATTDWACQTQIGLWQLLRDPEDIEARLNLAKAYEGGGFYPLAKREYEIVLTLEPENQEASEGAKRLKDEVLK